MFIKTLITFIIVLIILIVVFYIIAWQTHWVDFIYNKFPTFLRFEFISSTK
jgi:hypothetical protein